MFLALVSCRWLKFHDQIRLAYHIQRHLDGFCFAAFQLHAHFAVRETRKPPLKEFRLANRLGGRNLRQASAEPLEIPGRFQGPVESRRTDFQNVARAVDQLFHVQNHAELLADPLAVRVTNLGVGIADVRARNVGGHRAVGGRDSLRHAVDIDAQKPLLAYLPLDVNDIQPLRARHPLGGCANFLQIHAKTPRARPVSSALQPAATKKWLAPTHPCDPLQSESRVYSGTTAKASYGSGLR